MYPNIIEDNITIETSDLACQGHLTILNDNGQPVSEQLITQAKTNVSLSLLPSDVYFIRIWDDKTVQVGKVIKK
jgi:hypothetical protein